MLPKKFPVNWHFGSGEAKNRFSRWRPVAILDFQIDPNNFSYFLSTSNSKASYPGSSRLAYGSHLGFSIGTILLVFYFCFFFIYKSLWCFPPSFKSIGFLVQEKKWNIYRFSRWQPWWPSWISNRTILATRHSWPTSHPDTSYHVSSPLVFLFMRSEKQIFKMAATAAILDFWPEQLSFFLIYKSPRCFLPSFESIGLSVQEKKRKLDFQDSCHGGHLRFPIGMILAIFDPQVTLMLPTKFRVNWPFDSEEAKTRFSRWWPTWISDRNDFSYFWSSSHPDASYQVSIQLAFQFRRREKQIFMTHYGHWLTTIAHHEHFMLRWANKRPSTGYALCQVNELCNNTFCKLVYTMHPFREIDTAN